MIYDNVTSSHSLITSSIWKLPAVTMCGALLYLLQCSVDHNNKCPSRTLGLAGFVSTFLPSLGRVKFCGQFSESPTTPLYPTPKLKSTERSDRTELKDCIDLREVWLVRLSRLDLLRFVITTLSCWRDRSSLLALPPPMLILDRIESLREKSLVKARVCCSGETRSKLRMAPT